MSKLGQISGGSISENVFNMSSKSVPIFMLVCRKRIILSYSWKNLQHYKNYTSIVSTSTVQTSAVLGKGKEEYTMQTEQLISQTDENTVKKTLYETETDRQTRYGR